jgi:hypothetical protein
VPPLASVNVPLSPAVALIVGIDVSDIAACISLSGIIFIRNHWGDSAAGANGIRDSDKVTVMNFLLQGPGESY